MNEMGLLSNGVSPILIIAFSLFAAFFIAFFSKIFKNIGKLIAFIVVGVNIVISAIVFKHAMVKPIIVLTGGFKPPFAINLAVDQLSAFLILLVQFLAFMVIVYQLGSKGEQPENQFYTLFILNVMGVSGMIMTGDIFNLFVFFEITAISSYALVAIRKDKLSLEGAMKYLIISSIGSTLFLVAIALIYGQLGTLNMADLAQKMSMANRSVYLTAFLLIVAAFFVESEIFPFNGWAPDAYEGSNNTVTAMLSGFISKAGLYALLRLSFIVFDANVKNILFIVFGLMTFIIAELSALRQNRFKRMLAYSSIGQMGLILTIMGVGTGQAVFAGIFQILNHSFSKIVLFLGFGYIFLNTGWRKIEEFRGIGRKSPFLSSVMTLSILNLLGFPILAGFWSKIAILSEVGKSMHFTILGFIIFGALIEVFYYFRFLRVAYSTPENNDTPKTPNFAISLAFSIMVIVMVGIGLYPHIVTPFLHKAANALLNRAQYIRWVLGG